MTLEDMVKLVFANNPDFGEDEAVNKLKEMKDPNTNKSMWKASTIRNRVNTHLRKKEGKSQVAPIEFPVETKGSGSDLKIEGKDIGQYEPEPTTGQTKDPFAIKSDEKIGEIVDKMKEVKPAVFDEGQFKKEIIDDVSNKVLEQVSAETKSFKEETISIIGDLKSSMVDAITNMKEEMVNIQRQGIPAYEPIVKYGDIKLKQATIDVIQENTEEKDLKEESDYIDILIDNEKEHTSILQFYHKLVDLGKSTKKGVQLRLFYENNKLSYEKKRVGRFGINLKNLIAGVGIGIAIGLAICFLYISLTGTPATVPPIVPPVTP